MAKRFQQLIEQYFASELAKCTSEQQEFFHKLYPGGPRPDQVYNAADQIERTILKNEAKFNKCPGEDCQNGYICHPTAPMDCEHTTCSVCNGAGKIPVEECTVCKCAPCVCGQTSW